MTSRLTVAEAELADARATIRDLREWRDRETRRANEQHDRADALARRVEALRAAMAEAHDHQDFRFLLRALDADDEAARS